MLILPPVAPRDLANNYMEMYVFGHFSFLAKNPLSLVLYGLCNVKYTSLICGHMISFVYG